MSVGCVVICRIVSRFPGQAPPAGTERRRCTNCPQEVYVSPTSLALESPALTLVPFCDDCAEAALARLVKAHGGAWCLKSSDEILRVLSRAAAFRNN